MRVPLFPLNLVLFPGQTLPLHIFEERYKQMLQRCVRDRSPFGIVLQRETGRFGRSSPNSVGTLAYVTQVDEVAEGQCAVPAPHRGGCYMISCRGGERFHVNSTDRREAEYYVSDIDLLPDEPSPLPAQLMVAQRVSALFDEYYRNMVALMGGWQREAIPGERTLMFDISMLSGQPPRRETESESNARTMTVPMLPQEPEALSYTVAVELNVSQDPTQRNAIKQELLELPSTLARLQREAEILAEETPQLDERHRLQTRRRYTTFGASN